MDITQTFYDELASQYDKLFQDWKETTEQQAALLDGMVVASIRDYDALLLTRPTYSPPYIHKTDAGQRVSFQTWDWEGENYTLRQYIIEDGEAVAVSRFTCAYRATRREEITVLLQGCGCQTVSWLFPKETGFYQPIVVAKK